MRKAVILLCAVLVILLVVAGLIADPRAKWSEFEGERNPSAPTAPLAADARLLVTVVDIDGNPVGNAVVTVEPSTRIATINGAATTKLDPGDYVITASAEGYAAGELQPRETIHLTADAALEVELVLRKPGTISGRVVMAGRPVSAHLSLREMNTGSRKDDEPTNDDGSFTISAPPGRVRLDAWAEGSARATSREIPIADGELVSGIEIEISPGGTVVGVVKADDGAPLVGAVEIVDESGAGRRRVSTDGRGEFRIDRVAPGAVRVVADVTGFEERAVDAEVAAGHETHVELVMQKAFGVYGDIAQPSQGPLENSWALLMQGESVEAEVRALLGHYRIEVEPEPGAEVVGVSPFYESSRRVAARSGARADLALRPGGLVSGTVRTSGGAPVSEFEVGAESFEVDGPVPYGTREIGTTQFITTDGSFEFGPLRPGKYWLRAVARGHAPGSSGPIEVRAGRTTAHAEIVVGTGGTVRGRVADEAGDPISRAIVTVFDPFSPFAAVRVRTQDDGSFSLGGVAPGRRSIRVGAKGFLTSVASGLDVPSGGEVSRDVVLAKAQKGEKFSFHGIGAVLQAEGEAVTVLEAIEDRPAAIFGLKAGDRIMAVDGQPTADLRLGTVVELIRGEEGVAVELELEREGEGRFTVEVERGRVVVK